MITLQFVFFMLIVIFAVIGFLRGWAKELLVTFSVMLGIFIISVLENYVDSVVQFLQEGGEMSAFWLRVGIILLLTFFGYQTPRIPRLADRVMRERLEDSLLGIVAGALNGYLIVGSIWAYLHMVNYPFDFIIPPTEEMGLALIAYLPPMWLGVPAIYFAVAIAFSFIVIVFI